MRLIAAICSALIAIVWRGRSVALLNEFPGAGEGYIAF